MNKTKHNKKKNKELVIESLKLIYGIGIKINRRRAKELCLESSSKGNKLAQAIQFFIGWETNANNEKSFEILNQILKENNLNNENKISQKERILKEQQIGYSLEILAMLYKIGIDGVIEKDILKAIELLEKSVGLNNPSAMNNLALIYQNGEEGVVQKNILKSIELFEKAIELQHSER